MTVARVTEISATSPLSFEDAIRTGIERAGETLRGVRGAWVKEQQVVVDGSEISEFRVNLMVTFVLEEPAVHARRPAAAARPRGTRTRAGLSRRAR